MATNRHKAIGGALATIPLLAAVLLLGAAADSRAGVYKCVDSDGSITYAQTPCPDQVTTTVHTVTSSTDAATLDCEHANRFALSVAQSMKRGSASSDTYMKFGGVDAMSKAAVNIVSYVHSFQHSDDISADRIAALAGNRCRARAFGAVSCETLPVRFTDSIGGCDPDEESEPDAVGVANAAVPATADAVNPAPRVAASPPASNELAEARDAERRAACRDSKEAEIDRINETMRRGFTSAQGEQYRERLRALRKAISDC